MVTASKTRLSIALLAALGALTACGALLPLDDLPPWNAPDATTDVSAGPTDAGGMPDASPDAPNPPDGPPACVAESCAQLDAECGSVATGCGSDVAPDCGACPPGLTCGAGGPNRCGDGGCDAATTCATNQCGAVSNRCGGTIACPACTGKSFCNGGSVCEACSFFGTGGNTGCPMIRPNAWICARPPADPSCVFTSGLQYCCP